MNEDRRGWVKWGAAAVLLLLLIPRFGLSGSSSSAAGGEEGVRPEKCPGNVRLPLTLLVSADKGAVDGRVRVANSPYFGRSGGSVRWQMVEALQRFIAPIPDECDRPTIIVPVATSTGQRDLLSAAARRDLSESVARSFSSYGGPHVVLDWSGWV